MTVQALRDFGFGANWRVVVLSQVHLAWTLPLGFFLLSGLIYSAHTVRRSLYKVLTVGTVAVLFVTVLFSVFAFGFTVRGYAITGPFGIGY